MLFESTELKQTEGTNVELAGKLTIADQTHPVVLHGEKLGPAQSPWGTTSVGFELSGELDRQQFGLTWNQALETGGVLVGNKVELSIEVEVVEQSDQ